MRPRPTSRASLVLPEPPVPVRVRRRVVANSRSMSAISCSRPTKLLLAAGRLVIAASRMLRLPFFRGLIRAQPQRDVFRLQRLPYHGCKVLVQRRQVCLVAQPGGVRFEGLSRVVLAPVETPIDKALDAAPQRVEQGRYGEGRYDNRQLRLLCLARKGAEEGLGGRHAPDIDGCQRHGERAVDEGAVDDDVYVIEPVLQDGEAYCHGHSGEAKYSNTREKLEPQRWRREPRATHYLRLEDERAEQGAKVEQTGEGGDEGDPFDLLAHLSPRTSVSLHHANRRSEDAKGQQREDYIRRSLKPGERLESERVAYPSLVFEWPGGEPLGDALRYDHHRREKGQWTPSLRGELSVREQQDEVDPK